ncbi:MAG: SelB C-terminal domain-containing protein, partial [Armatimonadota bacterium]
RHLARIRSIEVHGEPVESVTAAQRVALNLARVEKQDLQRGDVIARPGSMRPTFMLDVRLRLLPDAPAALRNRDRLRVHIGTAEIMARAYLLDADELAPGQDCLAQLRLESPTTASRGDRLVLRRYSPMTTIAGGVVIDPAPRRHRRHDPATLERLAIAEQGNPAEILLRLLSEAGARGRAVDELARTLQWEPDRTRRMVDRLAAEGPVRVIQDGKVAVAAEAFDDLIARVLQVVGDYHAHNPLRPAMPKNALRNAAGHADAAVLDEALAELERRGDVVVDARGVRLADHRVRLSDRQQRLIHDIEARARRARFAPPRLEELLGLDAEAPEMVSVCLDGGALVDVEGFLFHADTIAEAKDIILAHTAQHGSLTVSQFRDLTRSTRKYAIPLLTYLDRIGFTRRDGDLRYLAQPPEDPPDNAGDPE